MVEPAYPERRAASAIDKYAFQLAALLKTEASKSRKQRRTLKQIHEDLKELGFEGSYNRVAAFARVWREGQIDRVNSASQRTNKCLASTRASASLRPYRKNLGFRRTTPYCIGIFTLCGIGGSRRYIAHGRDPPAYAGGGFADMSRHLQLARAGG